ncbi:metallophosphoesterase [Halobaculum sp. MBLA0147]|uniref:metallophosphoesterase family protein n=1 Tax=Halobaculum sp. MBLA0147 TaxID=3079934 RepID=UPI0035251318
MRLALLSDIHGNEVALTAVLAELSDLDPVDRLLCAGDVVGYNPWPAACVETIRERDVPTVLGNHDRAVADGSGFRFNSMAAAGVEYAREQLADDALAWLGDLPERRRVCDDRVVIAHGHPERPDHYTYPEEFGPELLAAADDPDLLVLGHTHVQHHEVYADGIVCNPGSVGQPRDGDPKAAFAVVDLDERTVTEHRVAYDIDAVAAAVEAAGLPKKIGQRLYEGR